VNTERKRRPDQQARLEREAARDGLAADVSEFSRGAGGRSLAQISLPHFVAGEEFRAGAGELVLPVTMT
jgi:hypothetical protein